MIRSIGIRMVANGYVVDVDCQTLVYGNREMLLNDLLEWLEDPERAEKRIGATCFNLKHTLRRDDRVNWETPPPPQEAAAIVPG